MTELAKRRRDTRARGAARPTDKRVTDAGPQPLHVEMCLPVERHRAHAEQLTSLVHRQVSTLLSELGLRQGLAVVATPAPAHTTVARFSIDHRPVAQFRCDTIATQDAGEGLLQGAMSGILRRLPLLLGTNVSSSSRSAYLAELGCRTSSDAPTDTSDVDAAELLIDKRHDEEIVVEVAAETVRRVDGIDNRILSDFREKEFRRRGITYPTVGIVITDDPPGDVRVRLNDVTLPRRRLGEDAGWAEVVRYLQGEIERRRHWFVRMTDVSRLMNEDLVLFFPDLVAVIDANYSHAQVTACIRELSRSGWRTRNFSRILWLLLEQGGSPADSDILRLDESPLLPKARHRQPAERDPMVMAVRVRKLAAEERWRLGTYVPPRRPVRLSADIEEQLAGADRPDALAQAEWAAVRAFATMPDAERVITRTVEAIGPVRAALQAVGKVPRVMASHELPPDASISDYPVLADPGGED